ncbi:AbiTii domain-containing protein [Tumebacillus avium]|nr:hypothetical protein [Tumebacillus avium]
MVLELQREALEQSTSVSILLRKAFTLAKKLQVKEFVKWSQFELNGYDDPTHPSPNYRVVHGEIKALNPYHGYIPVYLDQKTAELLSKRNLPSPITEIEEHIKTGEKNSKGTLMYKFPANVQRALMQMMEYDLEVSLHIPATQFQRIVDRVRNIILEWTLKLEEEGILGEGMTFSDMEKEKAPNTAGIILNVIGSMTNSQLQQNADNSTQTSTVNSDSVKKEEIISLIGEVKKLLEEIGDQDKKDELAAEISVLESQANSPKPKKGIIGEAMKSIRNIAEGTTGSLAATAILNKLAALLPHFQ